MLIGPTALVLGAGASCEFGLPTGPALADQILKSLAFKFDHLRIAGDEVIHDLIMREFAGDFRLYFEAAGRVVDALPSFKSIDDLLYTYSDDLKMAFVSKLAIAREIAAKESVSILAKTFSLGDVREDAMRALRTTWVHRFVQLLATGVRRGQEGDVFKDLFVVSFNYDRCFEAAVFQLIQPAFGLSSAAAAEVMTKLTVYRPYGGIGPLAIEGSPGVPYGPGVRELRNLAAGIKVYTEDPGERPDLDEMRLRLDGIKQIVFLGFGFHRQNVDLLKVTTQQYRRIFATSYKMAPPVREEITRRIQTAFPLPTPLSIAEFEYDCSKFMQDYMTALGL